MKWWETADFSFNLLQYWIFLNQKSRICVEAFDLLRSHCLHFDDPQGLAIGGRIYAQVVQPHSFLFDQLWTSRLPGESYSAGIRLSKSKTVTSKSPCISNKRETCLG